MHDGRRGSKCACGWRSADRSHHPLHRPSQKVCVELNEVQILGAIEEEAGHIGW